MPNTENADREARRLNLRNCERCGKAAIDPAFDEFESEWLMMMTGKFAQHLDHVGPVDLCPDCTRSFEEWWSTGPSPTTDETPENEARTNGF